MEASGIIEQEQEPVEQTGTQSILDRLKARRESVKKSRTLDLEIPGYEGDLLARYKPVPFKVFEDDEKKRKKSKGKDPALLSAAIDQIISCCDMILVRDPGNPACVLDNDGEVTDFRPIDVDAAEAGSPVKWEQRLADLIDIPQEETRGIAKLVVLRTFCNDAALIYHASRLGIWLRDTTKEVDDDLLGE
jgi:hypothetical protein